MKLLGATVGLVLSAFSAGTAYADDDGYYCVGRGYLAYQFGKRGPSPKPHRLSVIRFSGTSGIESPAVLDLPQFQVHGMQCGDAWIDVAAFTGIYHVTSMRIIAPSATRCSRFPTGSKSPRRSSSVSFRIWGLMAESGRI
jgi:hypothetical protein